jgi:hypothetical protein
MLPTKCNMPDLSDLTENPAVHPFLIHQLIGAEVGFPAKMSAYRRNLVRLADKAARDYSEVRKCVLAQIQEMQRPPEQMAQQGRQLFMMQASDKLEDCIITVRRLFRYFERIKSDPTRFPMDKIFKKQVEALEGSIMNIRDLIVHLDEVIYVGDISEGQNTAPVLDAETTTITIGSTALSVEFLARSIRRFHEFARQFAQHQVLPDGTYEPMPKSGPVRT